MIKNKKTRKNGKRMTKRRQTKKSKGMIGGKPPKPQGGQPPKIPGQPYKHFDTQKIENIHKSVQTDQHKHLRGMEERATRHLDKLAPDYLSKSKEILEEFHKIKSTAPVLSYGQKKDLLAQISATVEKNRQSQYH